MIVIGCDVSLRSPAFVVHSTETQSWRAYVWPQRKNDTRVVNPDIVVFDAKLTSAKDEGADVLRYNEIASAFTTVILAHCKALQQASAGSNVEQIAVVFEGYAYGSQSAHSAKLHEITGILKYLARAYPQTTIAVSSWKKATLGNGRAAKNDGLQHIKTRGPKWDLCTDFGIPELTPDEIKVKKDPKTPLQDISDAVCLTLAYVNAIKQKTTGKTKKRKNANGQTESKTTDLPRHCPSTPRQKKRKKTK